MDNHLPPQALVLVILTLGTLDASVEDQFFAFTNIQNYNSPDLRLLLVLVLAVLFPILLSIMVGLLVSSKKLLDILDVN